MKTTKELQQEVFDKVVGHLAAQGGPARDEDESCVYRAPDGRSCAVGGLIPDDTYSDSLEGRGVGNVDVLAALPMAYQSEDVLPVLVRLQWAHDTAQVSNDGKSWALNAVLYNIIDLLRAVADEFDLTFTPEQKAAFGPLG